MERSAFDVIAVIGLRKAEFYLAVKENLLNSIPPTMPREEVDLRLRRAISNLDNMLFMSDDERSSRTVMPEIPVSGLGLNHQEIKRRVLDSMASNSQLTI